MDQNVERRMAVESARGLAQSKALRAGKRESRTVYAEPLTVSEDGKE